MWQLPLGAALIELGEPLRTIVTLGGAVLAVFLGIALAKSLRMKDYGWKLGLIFGTVALGASFCLFNEVKQGIDLSGGTILIYEIDQASTQEAVDEQTGDTAERNEVDMPSLIQALKERIDPSGVREIVVRPYGPNQVEIIIPRASDAEIASIKRTISQTGYLKFRIVASPRRNARVWALGQAQLQSQDPDVLMSKVIQDGDDVIAEWVRLKWAENHTPDDPNYKMDPNSLSHETLQRELVPGEKEILMVVDRNPRLHVEGGHLGSVSPSFDQAMRPCVNFRMNSQGSRLFALLTGSNLPDEQANSFAHLGIVMDDELLSAPSIRSKISSQGEITGDFTETEVKELVNVLKAGRLPAVLKEDPISVSNISPLLGADTIKKGRFAIMLSTVAVLVFMVIYYRFAGIVACFALVASLSLIVALMILIDAAFTLPGLAGLVLTVGMSVDANVLIFERIREELRRGATLRMAIRNGFDRATTTIVDANITTLITALVLYGIGTDQIRGFAITLILGILMSMFTAIFCSRAIFEIAERRGWIKKLGMMQLVSETNVSFLSYRKIAAGLSIVVILIGLFAVGSRGRQIFDIDFNGGTSVQAVLKEPMDIAEVRAKLTDLVDENGQSIDVSITEVRPEDKTPGTVYKIDTSFREESDLHAKLQEVFETDAGTQLETHSMEFTAPVPITSSAAAPTSILNPSTKVLTDLSPIRMNSDRDPILVAQADPLDTTADDSADSAVAEVPAEIDATTEQPPNTETQSPDDPLGAADGSKEFQLPGSNVPSVQSIQSTTQKVYRTTSTLTFDENINGKTLRERIQKSASNAGLSEPFVELKYPKTINNEKTYLTWDGVSADPHNEWQVRFSTNAEETAKLLSSLKNELDNTPAWLSSSKIGSAVAGKMKTKAVEAFLGSIVLIILYIWIRFQRVGFGLAAVLALVHDVLITLGAIAASLWLAQVFGFLMIEEFKISLAVVAAFLTIVGYSLNDTIVVFDRIREVRGKSPEIREEMINASINQTLSRTLLTSTTTLIVVLILYTLGGQGIHGFAFALLVGVLVGTYSSIFVASPALLWLAKSSAQTADSADRSRKKEKVAAS